VNSCGLHGFASEAKKKIAPEHIRGKLSPLTISAIKESIAAIATRPKYCTGASSSAKKFRYVDDANSVMQNGRHVARRF
jgi:hypothetical protein